MQLRRQTTGQRLDIDPTLEIGAGGQARIYAVPSEPTLVAKVYREPRDEYARKLAVMLASPPTDPTAAQGHASIAWPIDLLVTDDRKNRVVGYVMPRAGATSPILERYNPAIRRRECPLFNYLYLYRTARNLAAVFHALHLRDYVIGDVNESNILVTDTSLVTLVDTDSFQVRDREQNAVFRCPVGRPEFTPPELQGKSFHYMTRMPEHDRFGLAVLIFQLLMEGTHPFAGIYTGSNDPPPYEARIAGGYFPYGAARLVYRPLPYSPPAELLPPALWTLFTRCFEEGHSNPAARPEAQTWALALREAEQSLVVCAVNDQHRYGKHLNACPWCARQELLGGRDPFPSQQSVQGIEDGPVLTTVQTSLPAAGRTAGAQRIGTASASTFPPPPAPIPIFTPVSNKAVSAGAVQSNAERSSNAGMIYHAPAKSDLNAVNESDSGGRRWALPVSLVVVALVAGGAFMAIRSRQGVEIAKDSGTQPPLTAPEAASQRPPSSPAPSQPSGTPSAPSDAAAFAALVNAINKGDGAHVKTLLAQSPQLAQQTGKGGWTPLHYAAYKGNADITQQLLEAGGAVSAIEKDGYTPLHLAAQEGKTEAARVLLNAHADVAAQEKLGWTPLHFAAQEGHVETAKLLIENGADVNRKENKGLTPLDVATKEKQAKVADLLRRNGAQP